MNYYDADEYWHCEHGFGPLRFDSRGRFFRAISDVAFVRVLVAGMTGNFLKLFFLRDDEQNNSLHCELLVDGLPLTHSLIQSEGVFEVVVDVRDIPKDAFEGFFLEIRSTIPSSIEAIFDGEERPALLLQRVGY